MTDSMTVEVGLGKLMKHTNYMVFPTGKSVVCEVVLHNGFVVHGIALVSTVYGEDSAKASAFQKAKSRLLELEAYANHDRIHRSIPSRNQTETEGN
jgi:hypothetical protein